MTELEMVGQQAIRIKQLEDRVEFMEGQIDKAISCMVSIGAPLNDNVLGYSNKQLTTFVEILSHLEETR